jgi:lipid-A-disaccharide synthase
MKLMLGVPLTLAIAEQMHQARPDLHFVMLVAPTLNLQTLARYGDPLYNPNIRRFGWAEASLREADSASGLPFLETGSGLQVDLWTPFPAYEMLSRCSLCLTTVGANTAELGALGVPMIVLLPTQQMDVMRAWDGLPGLLANLPGVGSLFAKGINWLVLRQGKLLAWPNIWAKEEIVPELVGKLEPEQVAAIALDYLNHPDKLRQVQTNLRQVRGQAGAAEKLVHLVCQELGMG